MENKRPTLAQIDPNLAVKGKVEQEGIAYYDVKGAPFDVYGLYMYRESDVLRRLPADVAKATNPGVARLCRHTSGGRVRFSTDSEYVAIHAEYTGMERFSHMALTGSLGLDLYVDDEVTGSSRYVKTFIPPYDTTDCFESIAHFSSRKMRHFTIHCSLYSEMCSLSVGVQADAELLGGLKYRDIKPVVYYGSSITQGGCVCRPGNSYSNVVTMRTGIDHINLGFSGSARGELAVVEYMADLDMSVFISDYDHNARTPEMLQNTHSRMYHIIREKNPDIPYIIISRPDFTGAYEDSVNRRAIIYDTYREAIESGDRNVYFIDGESIFRGKYREMATVDGCHPNDLGSALMADAIESTLLCALTQTKFYV